MLIQSFDLTRERVLTVEEASKCIRVSPKTVRRWIEKGLFRRGRGIVQLQAVLVGNRYRTSLEALVRFSDSLAVEEEAARTKVRDGVHRAIESGMDSEHQRAIRELREAGYGG